MYYSALMIVDAGGLESLPGVLQSNVSFTAPSTLKVSAGGTFAGFLLANNFDVTIDLTSTGVCSGTCLAACSESSILLLDRLYAPCILGTLLQLGPSFSIIGTGYFTASLPATPALITVDGPTVAASASISVGSNTTIRFLSGSWQASVRLGAGIVLTLDGNQIFAGSITANPSSAIVVAGVANVTSSLSLLGRGVYFVGTEVDTGSYAGAVAVGSAQTLCLTSLQLVFIDPAASLGSGGVVSAIITSVHVNATVLVTAGTRFAGRLTSSVASKVSLDNFALISGTFAGTGAVEVTIAGGAQLSDQVIVPATANLGKKSRLVLAPPSNC
jgi:hypothetical protein